MSGLLFLAVLFAWLALTTQLTRVVMRWGSIKSELIRMVLAPVVFVLLLVLPVADEIVGGFQFRKLCGENAVLRIDAAKVKGRKVREIFDPANEVLSGTAIAIYHTRKTYRDMTNGDDLATEDWYVAKGGRLIRLLGISEKNAPLTIAQPGCRPNLGGRAVAKQYEFSLDEKN